MDHPGGWATDASDWAGNTGVCANDAGGRAGNTGVWAGNTGGRAGNTGGWADDVGVRPGDTGAAAGDPGATEPWGRAGEPPPRARSSAGVNRLVPWRGSSAGVNRLVPWRGSSAGLSMISARMSPNRSSAVNLPEPGPKAPRQARRAPGQSSMGRAESRCRSTDGSRPASRRAASKGSVAPSATVGSPGLRSRRETMAARPWALMAPGSNSTRSGAAPPGRLWDALAPLAQSCSQPSRSRTFTSPGVRRISPSTISNRERCIDSQGNES